MDVSHRFSRLLAAFCFCLMMVSPAMSGYAKENPNATGQTQSQSAQDEHGQDPEQAPGQDVAPGQTDETEPAGESEAPAEEQTTPTPAPDEDGTGSPSDESDDESVDEDSQTRGNRERPANDENPADSDDEHGNAEQAGEAKQGDASEKSEKSDNPGNNGKSAEAHAAHGPTTPGDVPRPPKHLVDDDGDPSTDGYYAGEAIVRLRKRLTIEAFNARHGTSLIAAIPSRNLYLIQLPGDRDAAEIEQELEADPATIWSELNYANGAPEGRPGYFFTSRGDEDEAAAPYAPELVGANQAQQCSTGAGVIVAVLDTGVDPRHPLLQGHVLAGWNALDDSDDAMDRGNGDDDNGNGYVDEMTGHGTHVAGIVAQIAPDAAILPVKVLDSDGTGDAFFLAAGIYYALDQGAEVINLSLGSTFDARVIEEAVAVAANAGAVIVAAAGNADREQPLEYPAADRGAVAVAATDAADRKSEFSNYGSVVKLSAPGNRISSAFAGGGEATWSGTSMAAPFVSGGAALLIAAHPDWDRAAVVSRLRQTASDIDPLNPDYVNDLGSGRLDVAAAVGCQD